MERYSKLVGLDGSRVLSCGMIIDPGEEPPCEHWDCACPYASKPIVYHISKLVDKSARAILGATLRDDPYHESIVAAAGELVAAGMGHYTYVTQWGSGSTVWVNNDHWRGHRVKVDSYGRIEE